MPPPPGTTSPDTPSPDDVAALSLSVLDFYRQAAEAQFTFWTALLGPSTTARRDDEAA